MPDEETDRTYVAVIGDIRGSRELDDRQNAQEEFKNHVESLNAHVSDDAIASRFTVTTGDEFQGLLTGSTAAIEAAIVTSDRLNPVQLRFGIGLGELETELNPDRAIGMDGPCFHLAREAIDSARADDAWLRVGGWPNDLDARVNTMFDLVQCVREDWTERQAQFAIALEEEGTQTRVAERFDVTKSTVSQSLNAGHVKEVREAERTLATLLEEALQGDGRP